MARIVFAQEADACRRLRPRANRPRHLPRRKAQLEIHISGAASVGRPRGEDPSAAIYGLGQISVGVYLQTQSLGRWILSQSAKIRGGGDSRSVSKRGGIYGQIFVNGPAATYPGSQKHVLIKDGGLYSQTYGRAGELRNLAAG